MSEMSILGGAIAGYLIYKILSVPLGKPEAAYELQTPVRKDMYSTELWSDDLLHLLEHKTDPMMHVILRKGVPGTGNYFVDIGNTGQFYKITEPTVKAIYKNSNNIKITLTDINGN